MKKMNIQFHKTRPQNPFDDGAKARLHRMGLLRIDGSVDEATLGALSRAYSNLALVTGDVHKLVHATDPVIIRKYLEKLKNRKLNMVKLNKFRLLAGNCKLEYR